MMWLELLYNAGLCLFSLYAITKIYSLVRWRVDGFS